MNSNEDGFFNEFEPISIPTGDEEADIYDVNGQAE